MRRRHRLLHPTALLLALGALLGLAACGDDAPGPAEAPTPGADPAANAPAAEAPLSAPHPIRWVHGLSAGREAAGDPNTLLFVYLARHKPT